MTEMTPQSEPQNSGEHTVANEHRDEPLVYVPGLPEWPTEIAVTGSVWRKGAPTPFLVKPNTETALYVVRVVNEHEQREADLYGED